MKGEPGKYIETHLKNLDYVANKKMFVFCLKDGWYTTKIFDEWVMNVLLPYQKRIMEKGLLVLDKASCHISIETIEI